MDQLWMAREKSEFKNAVRKAFAGTDDRPARRRTKFNKLLTDEAAKIAERIGLPPTAIGVVSRGDRTLRAHYPPETDAKAAAVTRTLPVKSMTSPATGSAPSIWSANPSSLRKMARPVSVYWSVI